MDKPSSFDYIIVGQGLAGSCLALQLVNRKKRILVIDQFNANSATQVAAGLFNPVTGRKMTKTWLADTLFPFLHTFYRKAEELTGERFFHPMPLYRPFLSTEEQNDWMGKSTDDGMNAYLEAVQTIPVEAEFVKNEFGGLLLKQCGYLNTVTFTQAVKQCINRNGGVFEEGSFDLSELVIGEKEIVYKNQSASRVVFCEGTNVLTNKLFSWLPIRSLKGETLTIQTNSVISTIYNRGVYVVPDIWKVGATYSVQDSEPAITPGARAELQEKLDELISFPYKIITQSWGMRPTTPDRRPILGAHPDHGNVAIFNGLGTKGVSLAPYFSDVLAAWLENDAPINKEVDIERYKHYNYGGNLPR